MLESEKTVIGALRYNRVRLALSWFDNPIRLELAGMHDLEMILGDETWTCIDAGIGNLPVLAWKEFQRRGCPGLHEPVTCRVDYYNLHAELIEDRVLEIMDRLLAARLARRKSGPKGQIHHLRLQHRRRRSY